MKDNFINHSFDKLLLYSLVIFLGFIVIHIIHHDVGNRDALDWATGAFSTVLGALILILTGRIPRADGQTANGVPPTAAPTQTPPSPPAIPPATP